MGIVHFVPIGTSPGAATAALSYLQHHAETVKGNYPGDIIESVVLFCSHDVRSGAARSVEYEWNDYGRPNRRQGWLPPRSRPSVIEVVRDFLTHENSLSDKGQFYVWPVDVGDYNACFEAIARATLAIARADATGKYVWANLTGGTNILNTALMQVASLSGLIGRMYYTFVADQGRCYLHPFSDRRCDFDFVWVPTIKTTFDYTYYRVLELLQDGQPQQGEALLSRLKQDPNPTIQSAFAEVTFTNFKDQYLNRMAGDVLDEQRGVSGEYDRQVRLNDQGRALLDTLHLNELVEALIHRELSHPDLVMQCRQTLATYQQ